MLRHKVITYLEKIQDEGELYEFLDYPHHIRVLEFIRYCKDEGVELTDVEKFYISSAYGEIMIGNLLID